MRSHKGAWPIAAMLLAFFSLVLGTLGHGAGMLRPSELRRPKMSF